MKSQIDQFKSTVTAEGSYDLIAELSETRIVLTTEPEYFVDPSMNDTIDGTFRIFGKATRIIPDETQEISLLRKTALGKFGVVVGKISSTLAGMQDLGFSGPVETEVKGPAMQVIPVAIFS